MNAYINALLFRFDGVNGADAPTKQQVAVAWGGAVGVVMLLMR
jgi:hypothetical protein